MTARPCDNASVGVVIERIDPGDIPRWLFIWRSTFPFAVAPVAGHVFDEHAGYLEAASAEVREETGLGVEALYSTGAGGWRPNRCRRKPGRLGTGHQWVVYGATVTGELAPSEREVRKARWLSQPEAQLLAGRTLLYAQGRIRERDWQESPGMEPVWVGFLADLDLIRMPLEGLGQVADLMAEGRAATR